MELRSGSLIASGTGFTSAEQARAACLGQARVQLPPAGRPAFEGAVRGVLRRWTALRLAVENGWAGEDSDARAVELEQSILGWFYAKGDHYPDELEDHLEEFLVDVFHVEAEDGSPSEVSNLLVHVFELCAAEDYGLAAQLASAPAPLTALEQSQRDLSDARWTLQNAPAHTAGAGGGGAGGAHVTPDALADALGGMGTLGDGAPQAEEEPLEDGWERAPARRNRRGARPPAQQQAQMEG